MKHILKFDRLRLRGLSGAKDEVLLTAIAQNPDLCNAINDAYATGLIRQRTAASLGAQAMSARQQRARDRG